MAESPSDISQLVSLPCNAVHAEFYTSASSPTLFLVVSLNYLSAPSQLHLDYSRSTRSAFPSKFYYLAPYYQSIYLARLLSTRPTEFSEVLPMHLVGELRIGANVVIQTTRFALLGNIGET